MISTDIKDELSTNFIEYAAAVNSDRSIPDSRSGLKPVARRILWDAYVEGYTSNKPHVKSAKVVGGTMSRWHPHGDASIYDAMIRLSQSWIMRYPLIDVHGNNGSISGDEAAASRYSEARLSKLAEDGLLAGLKKKNVDFMSNYSEDEEEPVTLPAIFPNLLCNPNSGIGVACACSWQSHNLREVAQAINDYLDGKEPMLPGPDFPTGGVVINKNDIPAIMQTGHGSVKVRGKYKIEKQNIVFYEIPYGQTIEGILNEISEACNKKEIEGISEIRDESNKKGLRVVIQCDRGVDPESVVPRLFATTNLQTSLSYNQVALVDKTPTELNLKDCIKIYVDHNLSCLTKEANFDIIKAKSRLNIVEGLLIALEDIDNIIKKIKTSESAAAAKERLMTDYGMNEAQAKAVLDMKLAKLAKLEKVEVEKEKEELVKTIEELNYFLTHKDAQIKELRSRLAAIVKKYGDDRRTELVQLNDIPKATLDTVVTPEDVVIILSQSGYIKRVPRKNFKVQRRNGKGVKTEDDAVLETISTNTIDTLMLFSTKGKMYRLSVDKVPELTKNIHVNTLIKTEPNEKIIAMTSLYRNSKAEYVVFFTKNGLIKKTRIEEYTSMKKSTGIAAIKLKEDDSLANVTFLNDEDVIVVTRKGFVNHIETKDVAPVGRVCAGRRSVRLGTGDEVVNGLPLHKQTDDLVIITKDGIGKRISLDNLPVQTIGSTKGTQVWKESEIAGAALVDDNDYLLLVGRPSSICIKAADLNSKGGLIKDSVVMSVVKL